MTARVAFIARYCTCGGRYIGQTRGDRTYYLCGDCDREWSQRNGKRVHEVTPEKLHDA